MRDPGRNSEKAVNGERVRFEHTRFRHGLYAPASAPANEVVP